MNDTVVSRQEAVDDTIIIGLAAGRTHGEAAALAGVSAKSVQRRLRDPDFVRRLGEGRAARQAEIGGALLTSAQQAVNTLVALLSDGDSKVRLAAARELLSSTQRFVDQADVLQRLGALEAVIPHD